AAAAEKAAAADRAEASNAAAEAAKVRYDIDAEGQRKLNDSENMRSDASRRSALHADLIQSLPAIIRESVKPMEAIESIRILQVDGLPGLSAQPGGADGAGAGVPRGGNMADTVVNSALRYRTQVSFVDGLLREIGLPTSALSSASGLTIFPAGEEPEPRGPKKE